MVMASGVRVWRGWCMMCGGYGGHGSCGSRSSRNSRGCAGVRAKSVAWTVGSVRWCLCIYVCACVCTCACACVCCGSAAPHVDQVTRSHSPPPHSDNRQTTHYNNQGITHQPYHCTTQKHPSQYSRKNIPSQNHRIRKPPKHKETNRIIETRPMGPDADSKKITHY